MLGLEPRTDPRDDATGEDARMGFAGCGTGAASPAMPLHCAQQIDKQSHAACLLRISHRTDRTMQAVLKSVEAVVAAMQADRCAARSHKQHMGPHAGGLRARAAKADNAC